MSDPSSPIDPPDSMALPARPGAIAARFSADEVSHLAALLGLTAPPSVANAALAADGAADLAGADDATDAAIRRDLFARGVLADGDDGRLVMDDDALAVLGVICRPALVVTVTTDRGSWSVHHTVYARPGGAILETPRQVGGRDVLDYLSLPLESILPSVVHWTGLSASAVPAPGARPITVIAGDTGRTVEAIATDDEDVVATNSVTFSYRAEDHLTVELVSWSDCGRAGLWLLEYGENHGPATQFIPAAGQTVLDRLRDCLHPWI